MRLPPACWGWKDECRYGSEREGFRGQKVGVWEEIGLDGRVLHMYYLFYVLSVIHTKCRVSS